MHYRTSFVRVFQNSETGKMVEVPIPENKTRRNASIFSLGKYAVHSEISGFFVLPMKPEESKFSALVIKKYNLNLVNPNDPFLTSLLADSNPEAINETYHTNCERNYFSLPIGIELDEDLVPYAITPDGSGVEGASYVLWDWFTPGQGQEDRAKMLGILALANTFYLGGIKKELSITQCITKSRPSTFSKTYPIFVQAVLKEIIGKDYLKLKGNEVYLYHPEGTNSLFHKVDTQEKLELLIILNVFVQFFYGKFSGGIDKIMVSSTEKFVDAIKRFPIITELFINVPNSSNEINVIKQVLFNS